VFTSRFEVDFCMVPVLEPIHGRTFISELIVEALTDPVLPG